MSGILKLEKNRAGHDFVVSNIHVTRMPLLAALKLAGFDETRDRLFCAGGISGDWSYTRRELEEFMAQPFVFCTPDHRRLVEAQLNLPIAIEIGDENPTVIMGGEIPIGMSWQQFKDKVESGCRETIRHALWGNVRYERCDGNIEGIYRMYSGMPSISRADQSGSDEEGVIRVGRIDYIGVGMVVFDAGEPSEGCWDLRVIRNEEIHESAAA